MIYLRCAKSILLLAVAFVSSSLAAAPAQPLNCLIVGGGPDKRDNEVGIESNVRYVRSLLPAGSFARILYANGNPASRVVQYEDGDGDIRYRATTLTGIDGPSTFDAFEKNLDMFAESDRPLLLYFTGHGSPDRNGGFRENEYDLWGTDGLSVTDLSGAIKTIDPQTPVTLVMVQCFSGAFAPVFFGGTNTPRVRPNSCGFFASIAQREAAGCTPEVDEANYHDFTSYFFAALSGRDRVGRPVTGADYDGDGVVEMDEAYAYALIHDVSIDTPNATSDAYVRRFARMNDAQVFTTPYSAIVSDASPAQKAALDALSAQLHLTGEDRIEQARKVFLRRTAIDEDSESETEEESTARWIRFVRLAKTVVLEHDIETNGPAEIRAGLDQFLQAEHRNPLR